MMKVFQAGFAAAGFAAILSAATYVVPAKAADSNSGITWDTAPTGAPPAAAPPAAGTKDANGITWNTSPPPGAPTNSAPPPNVAGGAPDSSGIVWNTPGAPSKAPPPGMMPPPGAMAPPGVAPRVASGGECREFQTTIIIDGKNQPAHGTVCRQPDGTWRVVNQ